MGCRNHHKCVRTYSQNQWGAWVGRVSENTKMQGNEWLGLTTTERFWQAPVPREGSSGLALSVIVTHPQNCSLVCGAAGQRDRCAGIFLRDGIKWIFSCLSHYFQNRVFANKQLSLDFPLACLFPVPQSELTGNQPAEDVVKEEQCLSGKCLFYWCALKLAGACTLSFVWNSTQFPT